jgi:hypothetical protein
MSRINVEVRLDTEIEVGVEMDDIMYKAMCSADL